MTEAVELYDAACREGTEGKPASREKRPASRGERLLAWLRREDEFRAGATTIRFSDDIWDLTGLVSQADSNTHRRLNFSGIGAFADLAKAYFFTCLCYSDDEVSTIYYTHLTIARFLSSVEEAGYLDIAAVPYAFYEERYAEPDGTSYRTFSGRIAKLRAFLEFYEAYFSPLRDRRIMKLLAKRDNSRIAAEERANKTAEIEKTYLEDLLYTCHQVANDEGQGLNDRIVACCLMMYSQTGCHTGELGTFRAGAVSKLEGEGRGEDIWHAEFRHHERKVGRGEWTPTTCYMSELALEAFRMLEELCAEDRIAAGTDDLVVFEGGELFNTTRFTSHYHRFVLNQLSRAPFVNHPHRGNGMRAITALKALTAGTTWPGLSSRDSIEAMLGERGLREDDLLVFPTILMFRNTVCTELYRQRKSLAWIGRHLNHLYVEMDAYYNRADREIDKAFSNDVYRSIVATGARAVGPNGDAFMEKVDIFLEKKGYLSKIEPDPDAVAERLAKKYPLKKKRGGMCIRCAALSPCPTDDVADEVMCIFGVCPNHCSMFWFAPDTYAELRSAEHVVRTNLERGCTREAQHELAKMRRVLEARFERELAELDRMVGELGAEALLADHPELADIIARRDEVRKEAEAWRSWQI
ncbi:MAG: hypothetical protein ACI36Y_08630 [Coriobacteriales bacterium]